MNENVKVISSIKKSYMYFDPFTKTSRLVSRFEYRIQLAHEIADFIRKYTNVCRKDLIIPDADGYYLDDEDIVKYSFLPEVEDCEELDRIFKETVERISNQGDVNYFINHLLTENGKYRFPADIHRQMHEEFGLFDIDKAEESE